MTKMNWDRGRVRDAIRRYGSESTGGKPGKLSKDERQLIGRKDPGKAMLSRTISIKCYHCGHVGKFTAMAGARLPAFRCSACGHKGYPQKSLRNKRTG